MAKRNDGFKSSIVGGMEQIAKATAYTADGFRYFNVGLQGMIVFGRTMESGVLNAFADLDRGIASVINSIIHTLTGPLASALGAFGGISSKAKEMANNLNNLHIVPMPSLQNWASDAGLALEKAQTKLYDLVHQPMPSKNIDAWFANLQKSATASAKVIAGQALKLRTVAPHCQRLSMEIRRHCRSSLMNSKLLCAHKRKCWRIVMQSGQLLWVILCRRKLITENKAHKMLMQLDADYQSGLKGFTA